ncbi:MAG: zinc ribbon domain-containing protein, partial [Raoultibacter sp.]
MQKISPNKRVYTTQRKKKPYKDGLEPCPSCGKSLSPDASFCPYCGLNLRLGKAPSEITNKQKIKKNEVERMLGERALMISNDLTGFKYLHESGVAETTEGNFCRTMKFGEVSYEDERK